MHESLPGSVRGRRVVFFNWRDTANPEGGGSERYVEKMARGLVERGAEVTIFCAAHERAPPDEVVDGVRFRPPRREDERLRQGTAAAAVPSARTGRPRGRRPERSSFLHPSRHAETGRGARAPRPPRTVAGRLPRALGKVGWWIESRLAPRLYAAASTSPSPTPRAPSLPSWVWPRTAIAVVHNGTETAPRVDGARSPTPFPCVVGRLVPHKQCRARASTRWSRCGRGGPSSRLTVVGDGWWRDELTPYTAEIGASDLVIFAGHVSETRKHEIYARSWVMLLPSLKEGWGLVIGEAGSHGVPPSPTPRPGVP